MIGSKPIYEEIRSQHLGNVRSNNLKLSNDFDIKNDNGHRGYVLQISLEKSLPQYESFISQLISLEPSQNYVSRKDLHCTVFEFCSVRADYKEYQKNIESYKQISNVILCDVAPFKIEFYGTVLTSTSGIFAGYDNDVLLNIRSRMRNELRERRLPNLERYESKTAHVSFMTYREKLSDTSRFLNMAQGTKDVFLGDFWVNRMELVEHDWYNRQQNRKTIQEYEFRNVS